VFELQNAIYVQQQDQSGITRRGCSLPSSICLAVGMKPQSALSCIDVVSAKGEKI
jgi:hypothetical protein